MLEAAIILLAVGAGLIYAARYTSDLVRFAGAACIIVGLVLLVLWLLTLVDDDGARVEAEVAAFLAGSRIRR